MYFRSPDPEGSRREEIRLPEHYGGCAFSRNDPAQESQIPTNGQKSRLNQPSSTTQCEKKEENGSFPTTEKKAEASPLQESAKVPASDPPREKGRSLAPLGFGGLALDELLLLGLLLLLGREGEDGEILLLLLLLLLCGG